MDTPVNEYIALIGVYHLACEDAPDFAKIAKQCVELTLRKPGCLYFNIGEDVNNPGIFHLSEGWIDKASLDEHLTSNDFNDILKQASRLNIIKREAFFSKAHDLKSLF